MYRIIVVAVVALIAATAPLRAQGLFVITTDFATGSTAFIAPGAAEAEVNLLGIHADASGYHHDGRIYVVNRLGQDNILVLDTMDLRTPLNQFSVGNGANPHDIEIVAPDKAYVTRYDDTTLLVVNPENGDSLSEIDLSAFADADGLPEVSQIVRVGDRLYLSCQRLDRNGGWGPADQSFLIVVDIAADAVIDVDRAAAGVQGITLSSTNPNGLAVVGDQIVVSVVAGFGDRAGGVEIVDSRSNRSLGLVVSEEDLGGDITGMVVVSASRGYAIVSDENFANSVKPFDLLTGAVGTPLENISGGYIPSLAIDGARLIVADRGSFDNPDAAGLKIYDAAGGDFIAGPINTGLPPSAIVVMGDVAIATAVAAEGAQALPGEFALGAGYPNPFNAAVQIPFAVAAEAHVVLGVFDVLGRKVRTLVAGRMAPGQYALAWDGRDNASRTVGNGTYLVQLSVGGRSATSKVMLLK